MKKPIQTNLFAEETQEYPQCEIIHGQWNEPAFALPQLHAALELARKTLPSVSLPQLLHDAFSLGIGMFSMRLLKEQSRYMNSDKPFPYRILSSTLEETEIPDSRILELFNLTSSGNIPGAEIRKHSNCIVTSTGIYLENIGTLELRHWNGGTTQLHAKYVPTRSTIMLPSYHDNRPQIELPYALWEHINSCMEISMSNDKIPSVSTLTHNSRKYVITGNTSTNKKIYADAWSIAPIEKIKTLTHKQILEAYADGNMQRGDCHGQIVRIVGQLYALDELTIFYDDYPAYRFNPPKTMPSAEQEAIAEYAEENIPEYDEETQE